MFEELCNSFGQERLDRISELSFSDIDLICDNTKHCDSCPLALHYFEDGEAKKVCLDYATEYRVRKILRNGGYFKRTEGIKVYDKKL